MREGTRVALVDVCISGMCYVLQRVVRAIVSGTLAVGSTVAAELW